MNITTKEKLSGIFPPCMTIFDEHEEVDYDKIAKTIVRTVFQLFRE
jgi:dihydrodipicolinate synthase/N-acetylneuraminate lyase